MHARGTSEPQLLQTASARAFFLLLIEGPGPGHTSLLVRLDSSSFTLYNMTLHFSVSKIIKNLSIYIL